MSVPVYKACDYESLAKNGYYYQYVFNRKFTNLKHSHDFYEIIYILKGECQHNINQMSHCLKKGEIVLLKPDDVHYFISQTQDAVLLSISVVDFEFEKLSNIFEGFGDILNIGKTPIKIIADKRESDLLASLIVAVNGLSQSSERNDLIKTILSFSIQMFISKRIFTASKKSTEKIHHKFEKAIIEMSSPENIKDGTNALLRLSGYSRPQMYRLFKEHFNTTPHAYIINLQMDYAFQLVTNSDLSFEEIAEKTGYSSISHFQQTFKKFYGKSASNLRKENIKNTI